MRLVIGVALWVGLSAGCAWAQQQETAAPLEPVFACVDIADDAARLACYDQAVRNVRSAANEGRVVAVDREQVETLRRDSFGLSLPSIASLLPRRNSESDALDEVALQVQSVSRYMDGRHVFEMSNGQQWVQIEPARARNIREGDTITIRRAALGSFMMVGARGGAAHRVRRMN